MAISVGTQITTGEEVYQVTASLSSGGFGETFRAERLSPSPLSVVVKVPLAHVLTDPVWSAKFAREARILANIKHRNVVKIIAFWEMADGNKALVQELVEHASELSPYIKDTPSAAASIFLQTLYALRAFHGNAEPAAVHRDISPRNILIDGSGLVKVIDFGLAKEDPRATQILTVKGEGFGTPGCMSPEQLSDAGSVDHRTDLFALGRAFTAAIQNRNPSAARPEKLAEPWRTICMKLTEDEPHDRYQSAAEALAHSMQLFAEHNTPIDNYRIHIEEMAEAPIETWPFLCQRHFLEMLDFSHPIVRMLRSLREEVFAPPFNAEALFEKLEKSSSIRDVTTSAFISFDDADPIGELYSKIYPHLSPQLKKACFERVCRIAVRRHRFSVMEASRRIYAGESDTSIKASLLEILDRDDPHRIIEGRGIFPGR